jgi:hypothetical protein
MRLDNVSTWDRDRGTRHASLRDEIVRLGRGMVLAFGAAEAAPHSRLARDRVSFEVNRGGFVAPTDPNGAGGPAVWSS